MNRKLTAPDTKASARASVPTAKLSAAQAAPDTSRRGDDAGGVASHAIRVLCVDDHPMLVEGLKAQFAIDASIEVVGRLATAARLVDEVQRLVPDAVLLDIEMPGPDAFEMADRLKRSFPKVRVMVLSAHVRDAYISASFAAGACAYFSKSDELEDIVRGIHEVIASKRGTFVLGPKVRERCQVPVSGHGHRASSDASGDNKSDERIGLPMTLLDSLTAREMEILRLIGKGLSRTQIAAQLSRSAKTIDGHQERMMKKLGIPARSDLMRFAIREGLAQA
jgi:DNA-binding NarL/FixJ family response regulator